MAKILLDYVFPISTIETPPAASTAHLKQVCAVVLPKAGQEANVGQIYECTSMTAVAARTDNVDCQQLFNAGMSKVFLLLADDLDVSAAMTSSLNEFYTLLISSDFEVNATAEGTVAAVKAEVQIQDILYRAITAGTAGNGITIQYQDTLEDGTAEVASVTSLAILVSIESGVTTAEDIADAVNAHVGASALVEAIVDDNDENDVQVTVSATNLAGGLAEAESNMDVGPFRGVVGVWSDDAEVAEVHAAVENRAAFFGSTTNKAKNMFFAFGSLLSNLANWRNQQYITMPLNDGVDELGEANSLFDDKVSFVLNDDQYGNRLALFAAGGKAIAAPYVTENLRIDLQGRALQWIAANQPTYTLKNAALLETRLQEDIIQVGYIDRQLIEDGVVNITLVNSNFVATGAINITEPKALWRVFSEMQQTL
jgi:hypothetical protein